jgi:hypothetical protein
VPWTPFLLSLSLPPLLPLLLLITLLPWQHQFYQRSSAFGRLLAIMLIGKSPCHKHCSVLHHLMAASLSSQHQCHQCCSAFGCLMGMSLVGKRLPHQHCSVLRHLMAKNFSAASYLLQSSTSTHHVHCPC